VLFQDTSKASAHMIGRKPRELGPYTRFGNRLHPVISAYVSFAPDFLYIELPLASLVLSGLRGAWQSSTFPLHSLGEGRLHYRDYHQVPENVELHWRMEPCECCSRNTFKFADLL